MYAKIRGLFTCIALFAALGLVSSGASAALSIASSPLFLTISLPPNLVVLLDDSGSLEWAHAPDADGTTGTATVFVANLPATPTTTCSTGFRKNGTCGGTITTTYSCPSGETLSGSGSSSVCGGYASETVYIPDTNQYKSSAFNPLAYNPLITYTAPYTATGSHYTTSFTTAYVNGFDTTRGYINLSTGYEATVTYDPTTSNTSLTTSTTHDALHFYLYSDPDEVNSCAGSFTVNSSGKGTCTSVHNPGAAYYYIYNASNTGCTKSKTDDSCYTKVTVSSTSGPGGTDERQNFANWYSFYRTRNLTVASSADVAFNGLSQTYRVAWLDLHTCPAFSSTTSTTPCTGWDTSSTQKVDNRIATFTGQHRTDFFNWISRFPANGGTNLRQQLDKVGTYYTTNGVSSPYASDPQNTDGTEYVCRPNYAAVMTDGEWNEKTSSLSVQPGNADSTAVTLPDNTPFSSGTHPYSDSNTNTLADVAFHYWATNLRPDLGTSTALEYMRINKNVSLVDSTGTVANVAPYWNPENDPAQWPHMVTFTIGLGLSTDLTSPPEWNGSTYAQPPKPGAGYNDLMTGDTAWPTSFSCSDVSGSCTDPLGNVYDLWHTALDSRGEFFAADDPQAVVSAFNTIINRIQSRVGSSSSIAVNSTKLGTNTLIFQAQFNSSDWSGEVLAYKINPDGSVGALQWQASTLIPAFGSRTLFTWNNTLNSGAGGGAALSWANLSTTEQGYLNNNMYGVYDGNGSLRLNYLSGDRSQEVNNGGSFRNRNVLLGDIVDSNPQYVGAEDFGFDTLPEGATIDSNGAPIYDDFVAGKSSRTPVLYVGANDGMLHAINATNGTEMWAFMPRGVYPNLSMLTDPTYTHQYYVDGSPESVDAFFGSTTPAWHTLLAGGDGAGGREVFLLDVTTPSAMTASNVLYDYDGASRADNNMGYPLGQPTIARMNDGNWYMIWGNGYNSPNGHAVLYLYNINAGTLTTFDTGQGSTSNPNGMSAPAPTDLDGNRTADAIYAGDLYGNLWKLDVSSTSASRWAWAFGTKTTPAPLFTAHDASGNVQPITVKPQVALNKNNAVTVMFGTGTYFLTSDNTVPGSPPVMSFYGIIDAGAQVAGSSNTDRSELLQQFIVAQSTVNGHNFRVTTPYTISTTQKGWYMDFNFPSAQGERIVSDAVIDNGRIIFTTLIPQSAACQFGGTSWLMELDITSGSQLTQSPLDVNGDGKVNNSDYVTVSYTDPATNKTVNASVPVSGQQSTVGIIKTPGIISAGSLQYKYFSGSTGTIGSTVESNPTSGGRLSWQQLQ